MLAILYRIGWELQAGRDSATQFHEKIAALTIGGQPGVRRYGRLQTGFDE
jgi:hypothetical protein